MSDILPGPVANALSQVHTTNTSGGHLADGTFIVYDIQQTARALRNGDWVSLGLMGVTDALDTAATVSDPIGSLLAMGAGWLLDHLEPLKGWLEDLTGNAAAVEALSARWETVGASLDASASDLRTRVHTDLAHMEGDTIAAYRRFVEGLSSMVDGVREGCEGVAEALRVASSLVEAVHGIVRDVLAQIAGSIGSWLLEEAFTLGGATGWVIEQVSTRVAAVSARIGNTVRELVSSCQSLERLVNELDGAVGRLRSALDHLHPDAARGRHSAPWLREHSTSPGGAGRHRGTVESVHERIFDVAKHEVWRDGVAEGTAAGSNATASEEPAEGPGEER